MAKCEWSTPCNREAVGVVERPILGPVPACDWCQIRYDLKFKSIEVGDRVKEKEYDRYGTVTHNSHHVEYQVRWDDGSTALVQNWTVELAYWSLHSVT
jgi:hypothetical protein